MLLNLGYRSQVWSPYTLLNTIDLCTSPLLLYTLLLSQFQELRTGRLIRASASSMLKEGDWSHMGNMTYVTTFQILNKRAKQRLH